MIKKSLLFLLVLFSSLAVSAQIKWPAITSVTKPWTRWWWIGNAVNQKELTANMEQYKAVGLGGLEITPIYGVAGYEDQFIGFLSPKWMQMLGHTLREGKRLNLSIDMATGTGWPFGGGPAIGAAEACKDFSYKKWNVKGGERLNETVSFTQEPFVRAVGNQIYELHGIWENKGPVQGTVSTPLLKEAAKAPDINALVEPIYENKNLQALALDQVKFRKPMPLQTLMAYSDKGEVLDLTSSVDNNGKLNWTAPQGDWTLYGIFMGWHGKMVERAAPGGEGNVIDHFSAAILKKYLSQFDKSFKGHDLSGLRGFFNDSYEVDDARGQSNYTPALFTEFKKRRGYDLKQHLPALLAEKPDANQLRVLYDYRQTISDLLLEEFTEPWKDWAKAKGKIVRNQSHGSPANILDLYAAVDIPETEGTELLRFKFASSAANVTGKKLVSAEASTWLNEHFLSTLSDVKNNVDNYFLGGVNHIVYHGTAYSPQNDPWPGWLFYAAVHFQPVNPFWKDFGTLNNYVARCQSFLQNSKPDNDILLYLPYADKNSEPAGNRGLLHHFDGMNGFERTTFHAAAEEMQKKGYAWDLISDRQVQQVKTTANQLQTAGSNYQTIVLADAKFMPLETFQKLMQLVKDGATIIFYKNTPADVPGLSKLNEKQATMKSLLQLLSFTDAGEGVRKAVLGKGYVLSGDDLISLLSFAKVRKEKMTELGLQYISKKTATGKYYFIANKTENITVGWIPLQTKAVSIVYFDPMTQKSGLARMKKNADGTIEVFMQLNPGESCILQTSTTPVTGNSYPSIITEGAAIPLEGTWKLSFIRGGPTLPAARDLSELKSWTELEGDDLKSFSGTAKYSIQFPKPQSSAKTFMLDLGKVQESAVVSLNGKRLSTLIGPVYQVLIPASAVQNENILQVEVSNSMANRIIYLEKQGAEWKKFYNVNMPARLAQNRNKNGLFTAEKWEPLASGIIGPVRLIPVSFDNK
jgi:hypothetical protein